MDNDELRNTVRRPLNPWQVVNGVKDGLDGSDEDRHVLGLAARHDGVDGDLLNRRFAKEVRDAAEGLGYEHMDVFSGAGHDSVYLQRICPTAMIFVPCEGGVSHAESESITPEDAGAGANVLLHATLEFAGGQT